MKSPVPAMYYAMEAETALPRWAAAHAPATDETRRFEAMYRAHYGSVRAYARRRLPENADDVVAETFLVAWRRLDAVPADALPWLYAVARRVAADLRRGARRQEALSERLSRERDESDVRMPELPDAELRRALAALSEVDRELLLLVHWEDLEPARAARALGCSRTTVATRLWRAHRRLGEALEQLGGEAR